MGKFTTDLAWQWEIHRSTPIFDDLQVETGAAHEPRLWDAELPQDLEGGVLLFQSLGEPTAHKVQH